MNELLQIAINNPYFNTVTVLVTVASIIAAVTPTPPKGSKWATIYKLIDIVALNVLKAKQK